MEMYVVKLLREIIKNSLIKNPILYKRFKLDFYSCCQKIYVNCVYVLDIVSEKYPQEHFFKSKEFITDNFLFSIAYSKLICDDYLDNREIMNDFINKKLKSLYNGKFNIKTWNESSSEFVIFFYLICSIFFKSDLYKDFVKIEYEPDGANNKRFEYSFVFKDRQMNIEVKAIDCDPLSRDNLKGVKDGQLLGKSYFPNVKLSEFLSNDVLENINEISSNYRQVKKNIKRIKEKCILRAKDINIGFLIINYGTSREEYFSYLLNKEKGIIDLVNLDGIDNLVLFSMCTSTTLMFDEVYDNDHILSFANSFNEEKEVFFEKLRLDNYIYKDGKIKINYDIVNQQYGIYKYIRRKGIETIQPYYIKEEIVDNVSKQITELNNVFNLVNYFD